MCRSRPRGDREHRQVTLPARQRASVRKYYQRRRAEPGPTSTLVQGVVRFSDDDDDDKLRPSVYTVGSPGGRPKQRPCPQRRSFTAYVEFRSEAPLQCYRIDDAASRTAVPGHVTEAEVPQPLSTADSIPFPNSSGACGTSSSAIPTAQRPANASGNCREPKVLLRTRYPCPSTKSDSAASTVLSAVQLSSKSSSETSPLQERDFHWLPE